MRILFAFLALTLLAGCENFKPNRSDLENEKVRITNRITQEVALKLGKKFDLLPCGSGGQMMNNIEMLMLAFECRHSLTLEQAREILVESVETLESALNTNEQVRPYLANYPCTDKNIEIELYVHLPKGKDASSTQEFNIATCRKGYITYKTSKCDKYKLYTIREECFEEAKHFVQNGPSSSTSPLKIQM